jgi:pyrimidine operon attenuation protein/uracil phosphoribosyltransferase
MKTVLPAPDISRAIVRIAHEILERYDGAGSITLLGIPTRGAHLATRIAVAINAIEGGQVAVGTLDTTMHRDDLRTRSPKALLPTLIPAAGVEGRHVVLVDDVLNSGTTLIYGVKHFLEVPIKKFKTAVLVDRNHKKFPVSRFRILWTRRDGAAVAAAAADAADAADDAARIKAMLQRTQALYGNHWDPMDHPTPPVGQLPR